MDATEDRSKSPSPFEGTNPNASTLTDKDARKKAGAKKSNLKRRKDGTLQQLPQSMNLNDPEEMRKKMAGHDRTDHAALQEELIQRTKTAIKALQETTRKEQLPETV